jgi:hypothetical protein
MMYDVTYGPSPESSLQSRQEEIVDGEVFNPAALPLARGRPGRPIKKQRSSNSKRLPKHAITKHRRKMHNDSAVRSRARLNNVLETLWTIIPKHERILRSGLLDGEGEEGLGLTRAVKVEVALDYMNRLQMQVRGSSGESEVL